MVPGQRLYQGQKLIPSVSLTNWTTQKGLFSLQLTDKGLFAYVGSNPPQVYYTKPVSGNDTNKGRRYVRFLNGSLSLFILSVEPSDPDEVITVPPASSTQYMKLMRDGHLKVFEWQERWLVVADLFNMGVALKGPGGAPDPPNFSLSSVIQGEVGYWDLQAIFRYGSNASSGDCYLPFELLTLMNVDPDVIYRNASAFIKVQGPSHYHHSGLSNVDVEANLPLVIALLLLGVIGFLIYIICKRRQATQMEEESIGEVPGMPNRFPYEELKTATENFNKKLGEGGFGAVFEGTLQDDSKIAVKCLEGLGQVNRSFLAEVQTIGSIHHVNLVRLRGFSAWKSQRFLVYEFMSNGSLDRWIYHGVREHVLGWECRKKIIFDVAKGLAYLHEDCRQKIIHLDIKPQNILLDSDFNAKVSDFGLSKFIDRNQSQVMTTMRGTPGYLAPEWWLSSVITEKVDVYSFGIVLLEILCGRKNFDRSQ
ncbi:putative protein kinase RLK-Pelle-SD-2b family [Helianthus annuus]|nr:putative protein kinase RLK-Pelle-SD-2b family [Helianthus annuus]